MINKLIDKYTNNANIKEILTGSVATLVLKLSGMLLAYVVILVIARLYGAEGVGIYSLTLNIIIIAAMVSALGLNVSILRYAGQFNNNSDDQYKLKLLYRYAVELVAPLSIVLGIVLYFTAEFIALSVFNNPAYIDALRFSAIIIPIMALQNISVEFIRGLKHFKMSEFLRSVSRPIVNITLLLILGAYFSNKLLPLYTLGVGVLITSIISIIFVLNKTNKLTIKTYDEFSKKELLKTSLPMMVTTVITFILGNISLFFLEVYSTTEEVGIFSIALKLSIFVSLILAVVNSISAPKFSELYWNNEYDELQKVIDHSVKLVFSISLVISVLLILLSDTILGLFGSGFVAGKFSLIILIIGQLVGAFTGPVGTFLNMTGNQHFFQKTAIIVTIFSLFLNFIFIKKYGLNGAALATMFTMIIYNIIPTIYTKYKLGFSVYLHR